MSSFIFLDWQTFILRLEHWFYTSFYTTTDDGSRPSAIRKDLQSRAHMSEEPRDIREDQALPGAIPGDPPTQCGQPDARHCRTYGGFAAHVGLAGPTHLPTTARFLGQTAPGPASDPGRQNQPWENSLSSKWRRRWVLVILPAEKYGNTSNTENPGLYV